MRELIRTARFAPYRKGAGPTFTLKMWDTGRTRKFGGSILAYKLFQRQAGVRPVLFDGDDFGCSPMHAIDSDASVAALMGFLTLRLGDTDREHFANYTPAQIAFADDHAEALQLECMGRFGEY